MFRSSICSGPMLCGFPKRRMVVLFWFELIFIRLIMFSHEFTDPTQNIYADKGQLFTWYCRATTASCGSSGSGAANNACNESRTVRKVIAAAHWSFRMSKQMAPVTLDILGCQIYNYVHKCLYRHNFGIGKIETLQLLKKIRRLWSTFVMNRTLGGLNGYVSGILISNL